MAIARTSTLRFRLHGGSFPVATHDGIDHVTLSFRSVRTSHIFRLDTLGEVSTVLPFSCVAGSNLPPCTPVSTLAHRQTLLIAAQRVGELVAANWSIENAALTLRSVRTSHILSFRLEFLGEVCTLPFQLPGGTRLVAAHHSIYKAHATCRRTHPTGPPILDAHRSYPKTFPALSRFCRALTPTSKNEERRSR